MENVREDIIRHARGSFSAKQRIEIRKQLEKQQDARLQREDDYRKRSGGKGSHSY